MQPNEIMEVLNRPISQELPARDVIRPTCVAKDPTPRTPASRHVGSLPPSASRADPAG